jgi:transcriptional regulator with XRE-family HTH domain
VNALDLLRRRVGDLLHHSGRTRKDFAIYLGKAPSWATEFFQGRHGVSLKDLDRVARFFGVSVPQLFEIDGYRFRERRLSQRRCGKDRRGAGDRRKPTDSDKVTR